MLLRRVIPCLDVDKGRVVKGVEFVNLRDAGVREQRTGLTDPLHHGGQEDLRFGAAERRNLHEPALEREEVEMARKVIAADHVENHVDAAAAGQLADRRHEIAFAVIDRVLGAEAFARSAFLPRSCRGASRASGPVTLASPLTKASTRASQQPPRCTIT